MTHTLTNGVSDLSLSLSCRLQSRGWTSDTRVESYARMRDGLLSVGVLQGHKFLSWRELVGIKMSRCEGGSRAPTAQTGRAEIPLERSEVPGTARASSYNVITGNQGLNNLIILRDC